MNIEDQSLWFLYLIIASASCMLGCFDLHRHLGKSDTMYDCIHCKTKKFNARLMLITIIPGTALHGMLCALISSFGLPYLFIASPVQYIARFMAGSERSLFADSAFDFPREYVTAAIFIYISMIFAASCLGYYTGYRRELSRLEQEENSPKQHHSTVWSQKDTEQVPFAYLPENRPNGSNFMPK